MHSTPAENDDRSRTPACTSEPTAPPALEETWVRNEPTIERKSTYTMPQIERATKLPDKQPYTEPWQEDPEGDVWQEDPERRIRGILYIESREDALKRQRDAREQQAKDSAQAFARRLEELEERIQKSVSALEESMTRERISPQL